MGKMEGRWLMEGRNEDGGSGDGKGSLPTDTDKRGFTRENSRREKERGRALSQVWLHDTTPLHNSYLLHN